MYTQGSQVSKFARFSLALGLICPLTRSRRFYGNSLEVPDFISCHHGQQSARLLRQGLVIIRGQVLHRAVSVCLVLLSTSSHTSEQSLAPKLSSPAGPKLAPAFSLWRKRLLSGFRSRPCTLSHEARPLGRIPTLTLEPQGHFILPFRLGGLELLGWPRTHGLRKE